MSVTYHVLPPLSKLSKAEYEELGTLEGFTRSQGFYLYRQGRLLVYGTWFGLAKINDSSNLVRVEIEIDNSQDDLWNIDVKKSTAFPSTEIRKILKHYVNQPITKSKRVYQNAGVRTVTSEDQYWMEMVNPAGITLNKDNFRYKDLVSDLSPDQKKRLDVYLDYLDKCYPKERLYNIMVVNPTDSSVPQVSKESIAEDIKHFKNKGFDKDLLMQCLLSDERYASSKEIVELCVEEIYG